MYLGTDPEAFIFDQNGSPVPAHKVGVPDKKHAWYSLGGSYLGGKIFRDGYAAEANTKPNLFCRAHVIENVARAFGTLAQKIRENGFEGYSIRATASVDIDLKDIETGPDDVKFFGCDPSYCAYDLIPKVPPVDAMTYPKRSAGGHLHFSTTNPVGPTVHFGGDMYTSPEEKVLLDPDLYPQIILLMDKYLGLAATYLFNDPAQFVRREIYGQAGEFRPQKYGKMLTSVYDKNFAIVKTESPGPMGVEYRTLPPEIWNHPAIASMFIGLGRWVIHNFSSLWAVYKEQDKGFIRNAINTGQGLEPILERITVPGVYNFSTLKALKRENAIHHFVMARLDGDEGHAGLPTFAEAWGIPLAPGRNASAIDYYNKDAGTGQTAYAIAEGQREMYGQAIEVDA